MDLNGKMNKLALLSGMPLVAAASHPIFNGRAGLVLRRTGKGLVTLTASADGLTHSIVSMK